LRAASPAAHPLLARPPLLLLARPPLLLLARPPLLLLARPPLLLLATVVVVVAQKRTGHARGCAVRGGRGCIG
jgi:hypothetical protein